MNTSKFEKADGLTPFRLILAVLSRECSRGLTVTDGSVVELKNLGCKVAPVLAGVVACLLSESRGARGGFCCMGWEGLEKGNLRGLDLGVVRLEVPVGVSSMSNPVAESSEKVDSG